MDDVAERFVDRVFGSMVKPPKPQTEVEAITFYKSLNPRGWQRIQSKFGIERAQQYRDEMESRARRLGL